MSFEEKLFEQTYGKTEEVATASEEVIDTPSEEKVVEEVKEVVETPAVPTQSTPESSLLKDLGFETPEALKETLEKLKEQADKKPEFSFENETSKEIFELLTGGKEDELAEVLYTRKQLAKLENETDEEKILKAHIKFTNPEFDDSDVEDEYKEKYTLSDDAEFDEGKRKREEKKLRQQIKNDVTQAKEFFAKKKQDLKLPTTEKVVPSESQEDVFSELLAESVKSFKGLSPIEFEHKDENTSIPIRYEWNNEKVNTIKSTLEQPNGYYSLLATRHYDGEKYNTDQIVQDIYVLDNWQKILDTAVSQAVNKTKIEFLKTQKGISNNVVTERALPSELSQDTQKEALKSLFFSK